MQIVHVTVSVSICMSRNRVQFLVLSAELQIYKCLVYNYFTTFELTKLFVCCSGLTNSNYTELSQLYEKYKDQGFEILAFPCNQFGGQEPGTNEEIVQFACTRFKAEYPIFDKVDVNGDNTAPIYKFLKSSKGSLFGENIKWNFSKFLVDKEGRVVERYAPTTSPLSIEKDIKKLLGSSSTL